MVSPEILFKSWNRFMLSGGAHGLWPVTIAIAVRPNDHTSLLNPYALCYNLSGAIKYIVPTYVEDTSNVWTSLETPKSAIFTMPSSRTNKLFGLISLWITRFTSWR